MSHIHKTNPCIKLLSFSPDDKFDTSHKKHSKPHPPTSTERRLYQIYKQHHDKNGQNELSLKLEQSFKSSIRLEPNPEDDVKNRFVAKIKLTKDLDNSKFNANSNNKKLRALSTNVIPSSNKNISKSRPQSNQSFTIERNNYNLNPNNITLTNTLYKPPSPYTQYINQKHSYKQLFSTRIQNEKDVTFLSRTFHSERKEEENIKNQLVKMLGKTIELEEKEKQKEEIRKRHEEWLEKQRNENHTKNYMNHLMKYEAKKSLLERNTLAVKEIRERSQSASSLKSLRETISSRQKLERSRLMKQQIQENIQKANHKKSTKIREKSNSIKENKIKIYECESNIESWRIGELDSKARMLVQTIENSRKNKELLKNVVNSIEKNSKRNSSKSIMNELNKTLNTIRMQNVSE